MLNTFWTLHVGRGLELLLAKMLRIRELVPRSSAVPYKFQCLKKYLKIFGSYS